MIEQLMVDTPTTINDKIAHWASLIQDTDDLDIDHDRLQESVDLMYRVIQNPPNPDLAAIAPDPVDVIALIAPDYGTSKDKPRVTISTVHAVKGLEWEYVFLPHMNENPFMPARKRHPEEGSCWIYVAISRAKKGLNILYAEAMNNPEGWKGKPRSLEIRQELIALIK